MQPATLNLDKSKCTISGVSRDYCDGECKRAALNRGVGSGCDVNRECNWQSRNLQVEPYLSQRLFTRHMLDIRVKLQC